MTDEINSIEEMSLEDVKTELESHGVKLHHKTGEAKYRETLKAVLNGDYETTPVEKIAESKQPVAEKTPELTREQKAMRLVRIVVSPNDPVRSGFPGHIFTVCSSKINRGRAIKKYVPFNNDEGWHVPHIIYEQIKSAQMQKFKPVKMPNGETAMQPYLTRMYNVEVLPPLTEAEIAALAAAQKARGDA
jgi:hypothetical protein